MCSNNISEFEIMAFQFNSNYSKMKNSSNYRTPPGCEFSDFCLACYKAGKVCRKFGPGPNDCECIMKSDTIPSDTIPVY